MRSRITFFVLLIGFMAPSWLAHAQGTEPASKANGSTSVSAAKESATKEVSDVVIPFHGFLLC